MINIYIQGGPRPPGGIPQQRRVQRPGGFVSVYSFWGFEEGSDALQVVRDALALIESRMNEATVQSCDAAFRGIGSATFSELFWGQDHVVTLFRSPTAARRRDCGGTVGTTGVARHVALTPTVFNVTNQEGRDRVVERCAATIVHELAHCSGAPGGTSLAAENTLLSCGFRDQYSPTNVG